MSKLATVNSKVVYSEGVELGQYFYTNQLLKNVKIWLAKEQNQFNNQLTERGEWTLDRAIINETSNELFGVCRISIKNSIPTSYYAFNTHLLFKDGKYKYEYPNFRSIAQIQESHYLKTFII